MNEFCKWVILPVVAISMGAVSCNKKVAVQPPPQPQPTVTASTPAPPESHLTDRTAPPVSTPPAQASRYPDKATRDRIDTLLARISDAYFDYDKHSLRPDAVKTLEADSIELRDILKQYPDYKLVIEGHADERGSDEYNLGLGDARAKSAKEYLIQVGIPGPQLSIVSYGKERPVCTDHEETCWQKNRRVHIIAANNQPGV